MSTIIKKKSKASIVVNYVWFVTAYKGRIIACNMLTKTTLSRPSLKEVIAEINKF